MLRAANEHEIVAALTVAEGATLADRADVNACSPASSPTPPTSCG